MTTPSHPLHDGSRQDDDTPASITPDKGQDDTVSLATLKVSNVKVGLQQRGVWHFGTNFFLRCGVSKKISSVHRASRESL